LLCIFTTYIVQEAELHADGCFGERSVAPSFDRAVVRLPMASSLLASSTRAFKSTAPSTDSSLVTRVQAPYFLLRFSLSLSLSSLSLFSSLFSCSLSSPHLHTTKTTPSSGNFSNPTQVAEEFDLCSDPNNGSTLSGSISAKSSGEPKKISGNFSGQCCWT